MMSPTRYSDRHFVFTSELKELTYEDIAIDMYRTNNKIDNEKVIKEYGQIIKHYTLEISKNNIDEGEALKYAHIIFNYVILEPRAVMSFADDAFKVFNLYNGNEDIASIISSTLYNATQSVDKDSALYLCSLIKNIVKTRPNTETILIYAKSLSFQTFLFRLINLELCAEALDEIKMIRTGLAFHDTQFDRIYSQALFNYYLGCYAIHSYDECLGILKDLHALQRQSPQNVQVAQAYANASINTIQFVDNDNVQHIVKELKRLYYCFYEDSRLTFTYVAGLRAQSLKLPVVDRLDIIIELMRISELNPQHKEIQSENKRAWEAYFQALNELTPKSPEYLNLIISKLNAGETVDLTPR